ncbi:hypothetical protein BN946_scf185001.g3 [Trametes cinnabarina]|uniref:Uncharacterized protein n=1 Tax=Pycnoporus cinnabarinus TaxID=5643 RepID=A0A060SK27_PYCCI|nr:hypothetical protein BN946_scf185001.g3 [Trametes cinnabarina]
MNSSRTTRKSTALNERAAKRPRLSEDNTEDLADPSSETPSTETVGSPSPRDESHPENEPTSASMTSPAIINTIDNVPSDIRKPSWMTEDTLARIADFIKFAEPSTNRFAISKVPVLSTWGRAPDLARYLCANDKPLTVWLVGTVESKWFQNMSGEPQESVNIGIQCLRQADHDAAVNVLCRSQPAKTLQLSRIYARRRMTEWVAGELKPQVKPFEHIYDATNGFGRKSTLPTKYPVDIAIGDIVLVEAAITRYKTGDVKYRWEAWNVSFELQSVCILAHRPKHDGDGAVFVPEESDVRL